MTNVVVINENIKFSEKEYYHKDFPSFVNCYLQNTTTKPILLKGEFDKSTNESIIKFRDYLNEHGVVATIRRELGSDIDAACGQLRRKNLQE